ncbi:MAG TPA: GntR family transcriptional regulator [Planctomycetota bacterium]|nr:GntR family transcriptional regulator [Planctomycetota bacterium]
MASDASERRLRGLIRDRPGARLPGERQLSAQLRLPRPRLRRMLATLAQEGLVVRRHGSGTYAAGAARGLATATLVIDDGFRLGHDPFCATVIDHLEAAAARIGARLGLARTDGAIRPTAPGDGIITLGTAGARLLGAWRADDPPAVALFVATAAPAGARVSQLLLDDVAAGEDAARALIAGGCRSLMFLGRRDLPAVRDRLAGAQRAARALGVAVTARDCPLSHAGGLAAAAALGAADGVIAANDWLAVGLRAGLAGRGTRLPIVAFDGLGIAADPALAIASLATPFATVADDCLAELARLATAPGRTLRYACAWR